jgi:uncharacterized membrane protein
MMDERAFGEKISDSIAKFGGSWKFIFLGFSLLGSWVLLNSLVFFEYVAWDKYPFILLNLLLSCVAAFQAPFIMMSQRRCEVKQDMIYRSLFREIKELVETDLSVEHEIVEMSKRQSEQIDELKRLVLELQKKDQRLTDMVEKVEDMVEQLEDQE